MSQFWKRVVATLLTVMVVLGFISINKNYGSEYGAYFMMVLLLIPATNSFIRLYAWSKPFISSKFNVFTTKYRRNLVVDLPQDIAYGKFVEVIENSDLVLDESNDTTFTIFAYKETGWISNGENMYIHFEKAGDATRMVFLSVSFKAFEDETNHRNLIDLIDQFENSLTI